MLTPILIFIYTYAFISGNSKDKKRKRRNGIYPIKKGEKCSRFINFFIFPMCCSICIPQTGSDFLN
jgi:cytosine/uracil/thiamine/allantoin permease